MRQIAAANIQEALTLARRELGEDAVLLDTKKAANGKGIVVTFAIEEEENDNPFADDVALDPADILAFTPHIPRPATAKVEIAHPALQIVADALKYHGLPSALSERILTIIHRIPLRPDALHDVAEAALAAALQEVLVFKPIATGAPVPPNKAIMLVGPHGAGKTSTIAKIAAELTMHKQPVILISTDMERMGGTDNLHQLADILKCHFYIGDTRANLKSLIAQFAGKAWVLIDSTGANIYEFKQLKALGEFAGLQGIEPILVCPAGMDAAEAQEMAGVFNFLNIERMIVTRLDAVRRLGAMFAALSTGGYALSNFSNSAKPTDACIPISAAATARLMLRHVRERMEH